jgi:hypothetical protein
VELADLAFHSISEYEWTDLTALAVLASRKKPPAGRPELLGLVQQFPESLFNPKNCPSSSLSWGEVTPAKGRFKMPVIQRLYPRKPGIAIS